MEAVRKAGRSEAAASAKKAHDVGEAMVIAACHSWPLYDTLMQEVMRKSRGDFKSYLRM